MLRYIPLYRIQYVGIMPGQYQRLYFENAIICGNCNGSGSQGSLDYCRGCRGNGVLDRKSFIEDHKHEGDMITLSLRYSESLLNLR